GCPSCARGVPAWVCGLGRPGSTTAISLTSPSLFSQVCNCNKYLKVSRERMRQLVEGSRQASGEHSEGCPRSQSCDVTVPVCATAHGETTAGAGQCRAAAVLAPGTVLRVAAVPPGVLDRAELTEFYCCTRCGKVFWEGSHFGRVVSQFQDVLVASGDTQSVYELS
ncbi:MUT7 Exonuclease, partial [Notiomystis cincta]|nr:MUT7 Exonuclease [Notiomystis cincta]